MWFKVDDQVPFHPKFAELPTGAIALWFMSGALASNFTTDGTITLAQIRYCSWGNSHDRRQQRAWAGLLVSVGLWEVISPDMWRFKDWHHYQPTAEYVKALQESRSTAGRRGGLASAQANAKAVAMGKPSDKLHPVPSRPVPTPREGRDSEETTAPAPPPVVPPGDAHSASREPTTADHPPSPPPAPKTRQAGSQGAWRPSPDETAQLVRKHGMGVRDHWRSFAELHRERLDDPHLDWFAMFSAFCRARSFGKDAPAERAPAALGDLASVHLQDHAARLEQANATRVALGLPPIVPNAEGAAKNGKSTNGAAE